MLLAASRAYSAGVWMSVSSEFYSNLYSYSFSLILTKLGTHVLCASTEKTVEQIFKILL